MRHLFILFVSLFVLVPMAYAENPGVPFQQLMDLIGETNVKLDIANDKLDETVDRTKELKKGNDVVQMLLKDPDKGLEVHLDLLKKLTEAVKETPINSVLITGSQSWITPYWSIKEIGSDSTFWAKDYSYITILNLSRTEWASVLMAFRSHDDGSVGEIVSCDLKPMASKRFLVESELPNEPECTQGQVRLISNQKVVVEGEIVTTTYHNDDYAGTRSRAMTWYPVELDLE